MNKLNGFNNGIDPSDGVGGEKVQRIFVMKESEEMMLNRFAVDFYYHLRPSKLMTTNDIAQYIMDWMNENNIQISKR
jgi:hypothetical protein